MRITPSRMTASDLASALEGKREGREWRCRCPVHGGRSLSVTEKDGRLLVVCRAGCSQGEVISELKRLGLWEGVTGYESTPPPESEPSNHTERKADRASELWNESLPITPGNPVHSYLKNRGIVLPEYPSDLRSHPHLDYWEIGEDGKPVRTGTFPAILAIVRNPQGRPVALHRTYLTEDGHKAPVSAPKKIMKVYDLAGSAVKLFPPMDGVLGVCEGIEDALSAFILWRIPTWTCLGTSGLKGFEPPGEVQELVIFTDNDEPGKKAAIELAERMEEKGKAVRIRVPSGHKDINEVLKGACK